MSDLQNFNMKPLFSSLSEAEALRWMEAFEVKHPRCGIWMERDIFSGQFQVFGVKS